MDLDLKLVDDGDEVIVETALMKRTIGRTMAALKKGGLSVWTGQARLGKTCTARWFVRKLEEQHDRADPATFRALHYQVGEVKAGSGHEQKRGINSLYSALLDDAPISENEYRRLTTEQFALRTALAAKRKNIRILLVDEAGTLSLNAIRGMVLVNDKAVEIHWRMCIVFIGMDDLPTKMDRLPQIAGRVQAWCYFEEYSLAETQNLLAKLSPHFVGNTVQEREELQQEVKFLHDTFGGFPGLIVPFLAQAEERAAQIQSPLNRVVLETVSEHLRRDHDRAVKDARTSYGRKPAASTAALTAAKKTSRRGTPATAPVTPAAVAGGAKRASRRRPA